MSLKSSFKNVVNSLLANVNLELRSTRPITSWRMDDEFNRLYAHAQEKTQMAHTDNEYRRQRHYVLLQFFRSIGHPQNAVAECGSWRGLSSYQMCTYMKKYRDQGLPVEYHIFDSFEGLSEPTSEDIPDVAHVTPGKKGMLCCGLDQISSNLSQFLFIEYHKGWIPEKFHEVANKRFSFVHIDVDLYQPIKDAVEFFYPRLDAKGMIVFDDYAYLQFPGAMKAVEEFVAKSGCRCLRLTTGQAVILSSGG